MSVDVNDLIEAITVAKVAREHLDAIGRRGIQPACAPLLTLMASVVPEAEYALRLVASANKLEPVECVMKYDDGTQIRTLSVGNFARVQFDRERIPVVGDAASAWSPAHGPNQSLEAR
jgi:hypothetical protein